MAAPKKTDNLLKRAIAASALYGILGAIYFAFNLENIFKLAPNEFGDFVAGLISPLAFFWIVVGYFLQAEELRNSVEALKVQSEELSNSVEQYRQMVALDRERLNFDRDESLRAEQERKLRLKPILRVRNLGSDHFGSHATYKFSLNNIGNDCRDVSGRVFVKDLIGQDAFDQRDHLPHGGSIEWHIVLHNNYFDTGKLEVSYQDIEGSFHNASFKIAGKGHPNSFAVLVDPTPIE